MTPILKKVTSPQWLELPPAPLSCNNLSRLRHSLLFVRVCNKQSDGSIVGRAIISLTELHAEAFQSEAEATQAALEQADMAGAATAAAAGSSPHGGRPLDAHSDVANVGSPRYAYRGQPHTLHFDVDVTYAGMPAGNISGSVTIMWKAKGVADK